MIELRTLGTLDLTGPDGRELGDVLSRRHRVALLVYLALQHRRSFVPRDTLLAIFWPELDQAHARRALRQALHLLRSRLGHDVLVTRGRVEVGIAGDVIWCDAQAFERALAAGDARQALALYRGELLEGFFLSEVPEFEQWLEKERSRLRERAAAAAAQLAEAAETEGDLAEAAHWLRRTVGLVPDETHLRALIRVLDRAGDRAAALQAYNDFTRRLRSEFELEPSPETSELVSAMCARTDERGEHSDARIGSQSAEGTTGATTTGPPESGAATPRSPPSRRRTPVWALAAGALLVVSTGTGGIWWQRAHETSATDVRTEPRLVVLPFATRGAPDIGYLGEGMADVLSTNLDGTGLYRAVNPAAVIQHIRAAGAGLSDPALANGVARRFEAEYLLVGSVLEAEGQLRIHAALFARDDSVAITAASQSGSVADLFAMVDALSAELLAGSDQRLPGGRLRSSAALTTSSLGALRQYLEGEQAMREGMYPAALEAFRRAVAVDNSFALAHYRLSVAAAWAARSGVARSAGDRAWQLSERLSERDRSLLWAHYLTLHARFDEAETLYHSITASYPDEAGAWLELGELLFHHNAQRGRSHAEARPAFEKVLVYDADNLAALLHLARLAAAARDRSQLDSLVQRAIAVETPMRRALEMRVLQAVLAGEREVDVALRGELESADDASITNAAFGAAVYAGDIEAALRLLSLATAVDRPPSRRALAHAQMAYLEMARGRWRSAAAACTEAMAVHPVLGIELCAVLVAQWFVPAPHSLLRAWSDTLATRSRLDAAEGDMPVVSTFAGLHPHLHPYLLGALSIRMGDLAAARRYATELETLPHAAGEGGGTRELVQELRARITQAEGTPNRALRELEAAAPDVLESEAHPIRSAHRYVRSEILFGLRRDREALGWYGTFEHESAFSYVFAAPSYLRRGEILERLGDSDAAAEHYARFVDMWSTADAELQPLVVQAMSRLEALESRASSGR